MLQISEIVHASHFLHQRSKQVFFLVIALLIDIISKVTLILLLRVNEGFDGIIACLHAESDTLVQDGLRFVGCIHIVLRKRLNVLFVMVNGSVNYTISDSFCNDLLSLFNTLQIQFRGYISQRDLRVRDIDLLKTEFDDCVL